MIPILRHMKALNLKPLEFRSIKTSECWKRVWMSAGLCHIPAIEKGLECRFGVCSVLLSKESFQDECDQRKQKGVWNYFYLHFSANIHFNQLHHFLPVASLYGANKIIRKLTSYILDVYVYYIT